MFFAFSFFKLPNKDIVEHEMELKNISVDIDIIPSMNNIDTNTGKENREQFNDNHIQQNNITSNDEIVADNTLSEKQLKDLKRYRKLLQLSTSKRSMYSMRPIPSTKYSPHIISHAKFQHHVRFGCWCQKGNGGSCGDGNGGGVEHSVHQRHTNDRTVA